MKRVYRYAAALSLCCAAEFVCIIEYIDSYPVYRHPWRHPMSFVGGIAAFTAACLLLMQLVYRIGRSPARGKAVFSAVLTVLMTLLPFMLLCAYGEYLASDFLHQVSGGFLL